jgi:hypothetical protein
MLAVVASALATTLADCPRQFDTTELTEAVAGAERAFAELDGAGFLAGQAAVVERLECVRDPLAREVVARVHRVQALAAFFGGRPAQVPQALAGLFAVEPGHPFPPELVPEGHRIRGMFAPSGALARDPAATPLPVLAAGWIEVDGESATLMPTRRAAIVQQLDGQGLVVETHYAWPEAGPVELTAAVPAPARHTSPRLVWLGAAGATAVGTGVLYALASASHQRFEEDALTMTESEMRAEQARANGLSAGWMLGLAATAGLGVAVAVTW